MYGQKKRDLAAMISARGPAREFARQRAQVEGRVCIRGKNKGVARESSAKSARGRNGRFGTEENLMEANTRRIHSSARIATLFPRIFSSRICGACVFTQILILYNAEFSPSLILLRVTLDISCCERKNRTLLKIKRPIVRELRFTTLLNTDFASRKRHNEEMHHRKESFKKKKKRNPSPANAIYI